MAQVILLVLSCSSSTHFDFNFRVMAQVSCQVVEPKQARPSDGTLFINVELSPMACPGFEPGRLSDFGIEINRLLERCLKESRCLDTESLCIVSGERVSF